MTTSSIRPVLSPLEKQTENTDHEKPLWLWLERRRDIQVYLSLSRHQWSVSISKRSRIIVKLEGQLLCAISVGFFLHLCSNTILKNVIISTVVARFALRSQPDEEGFFFSKFGCLQLISISCDHVRHKWPWSISLL